MSNSRPLGNHPVSNTKFWILAVLVLAGFTAACVALWPVALAAAIAQSASLQRAGDKATGSEAEADYRLAMWLNPHNEAAFLGLARLQITYGHAEEAVVTLNQAGEGRAASQLQIRTLIELGRYSQAASEAGSLLAQQPSDEDFILAGLAFALAGRGGDIPPLIARVSSPQATQTLTRAQASQITLAAELYAAGLLRSSSALLVKLPPSYERNLRLAHIRYTRHTAPDLTEAGSYLEQAVALNPAAIEARRLLATVYRDLHQLPKANEQDILIAKLQAGRP